MKGEYSNTTTFRIDAKEAEYLYVKESQIPGAGKGLFVAIPIYKGEVISHFKGEILDAKTAKQRAQKKLNRYFINMIDGTVMDSMQTKCFAKYANDSNGSIKAKYKNNAEISLDENDNVCIVAKRNIKTGEEIFCGYGKDYWKTKT